MVTIDDSGECLGMTRLDVDNIRLNGNTMGNPGGTLIVNSNFSNPIQMQTQDLQINRFLSHLANTDNYLEFVTDIQRYGVDSTVRMTIDTSGVTFGAGVAITQTLDEDDMASDSATALATQQSIKAYVDAAASAWSEVTGTSQSMVVNGKYIANNAALVTLTLPVTAAVGATISVQGSGAGGWRVAQNASQIINVGVGATTVGVTGYLQSITRYDSVELVCIVANTTWVVRTAVAGTVTIV